MAVCAASSSLVSISHGTGAVVNSGGGPSLIVAPDWDHIRVCTWDSIRRLIPRCGNHRHGQDYAAYLHVLVVRSMYAHPLYRSGSILAGGFFKFPFPSSPGNTWFVDESQYSQGTVSLHPRGSPRDCGDSSHGTVLPDNLYDIDI